MSQLSRRVDDKHTLVYSELFPKREPRDCDDMYVNNVLVGIGGNIGDMTRRFDKLYHFWVKSKYVCLMESSPILINPPFGYVEQDDFHNAVVYLKTNLTASEFMRYLLRVERLFGRQRSFQDAPRTIDLDIIFFNMIKISSDFLTIPHASWHERKSVTIPLGKMKGVSWLKRHL